LLDGLVDLRISANSESPKERALTKLGEAQYAWTDAK
jgi:hypothetical protein